MASPKLTPKDIQKLERDLQRSRRDQNLIRMREMLEARYEALAWQLVHTDAPEELLTQQRGAAREVARLISLLSTDAKEDS